MKEKKEERGKREIEGGRNFGLLTEFEGETLILGAAWTEISPELSSRQVFQGTRARFLGVMIKSCKRPVH